MLSFRNAKQTSKNVADTTFKPQPYKMVKHTQTIRRLLPANCLNVFDHFVGLGVKVLIASLINEMSFLNGLCFKEKNQGTQT